MFSRVIHGTRVSLYVGLISVAFSTVAGGLIGIASGYLGGKPDLLMQRVVDALMAFPTLVMALIIVAAFGSSISNVIIAIVAALTPRMVRISRAQALSVREELYIVASQSIGIKPFRVMIRHILPNSLAPIIVLATGYLAEAVIAEAALSFLGLGVPPPDPSWGRMLQEGAPRISRDSALAHHLPRHSIEPGCIRFHPLRRCPARRSGSQAVHLQR